MTKNVLLFCCGFIQHTMEDPLKGGFVGGGVGPSLIFRFQMFLLEKKIFFLPSKLLVTKNINSLTADSTVKSISQSETYFDQ